jgi:hypothetical protein
MVRIPILTRLVDAQEMHRQYPDTFEAPTDHELATIRPGQFIKVCRDGERFWLAVTGASGRYLIASIANPLVTSGNARLAMGKAVRVEPRHVYSIMNPPG